ncbi:zinc-binding dehydrogenase [Nocardioides sp. TRM66260-LWL]|uniref:zinc-binding dehydrogenase n=1 Tax=Nocardioides sp. TRM66260-LWL TaxID=2874478 RepID=UPI001CC388B0|nr:zinc-binding dehydrogenase [Nocardioides sp. TRM66260-LWL]MBZ5734597.1 zinc-binding dehydrogenase [Nocardioides sp. TRM66260-LWL]
MKATVLHRGQLRVEEVPDPVPGPGQVLVEVAHCGICGSDLHARHHGDATAELARAVGYDDFLRSEQHVVLGHEFSGRVLGYGPRTRRTWKEGQPLVALPILQVDGAPQLTGLAAPAPGGYAERVLVQEAFALPVPDDVPLDVAALTEPMAVALHAVRRGGVGRTDTAVVIGCGPIGLAVIAMLKASGRRTVVASDLSPRRRELALACGADVVVDPGVESPWEQPAATRGSIALPDLLTLGLSTTDRLRRVPLLPWWEVFKVANRLGATPGGPVVFECVGVPGIIDQIVMSAPARSRVVVVGVCMEADSFQPAMAINKELDLRFAFGYDPGEFAETLRLIADGRVDPRLLITGGVGLAGVDAAFAALGDPETHAKILVDPTLGGDEVVPA